jgi:Uma2 family endonuclease
MNVREYERLTAAGVLDDPRVELVDGYVIKKMGKNPPHIWAVDAIIEALRASLPGWWCRKEDPVQIPEFDEPEPDVAVVRGSREDYRGRIPGPSDIALVVEVSESTIDRDRALKCKAYARGGIACYWIVNLVDRQVEIYTTPVGDDYRSVQVIKPGQEISINIAGSEVGRIPVSEVLP